MTPDNFAAVPIVVLLELALTKMVVEISAHKRFLVLMEIARHVSHRALAKNIPPANVEEALIAQAVKEPGRLTDPRIATLPGQLMPRIIAFEACVRDVADSELPDPEYVRQLVKDIKQLNADIAPVYQWHAELRAALARATAEMN